MFTLENTQGFTQADCDLMNAALETLLDQAGDVDGDTRAQLEHSYSDRINNNWQESGNTVESLIRA